MVEISLGKGRSTIVDDVDSDLACLRWCFVGGYAGRNMDTGTRRENGRKRYTLQALHHVILSRMGYEVNRQEGRLGDHKNRNPLDNRRSNLRIVSPQHNASNKRRKSNKTCCYKGVQKQGTSWTARLMLNGRQLYLGSFKTAEAAAAAYDQKAIEVYGDYAATNLVDLKGSPSHSF